MLEEQQPLLPVTSNEHSSDTQDDKMSWHAKTRAFLESPRLHIAVIILIAVDATCVLADLTYSLLSPECGGPPWELPPWLEVLAHISLVITSFFMVEIPLSLWAFGLGFYNPFGTVIHAGLHLFDAAIIIITFVLEVALKGRERELAGLLIILRLWRLVKLVGGVAVGAGEISEETALRLSETRAELDRVKSDLSAVRSENHTLRQRLGMHTDITSSPGY